MPLYKIFFSYSRADTETAIKIATQLRNEGADIWLDQLDIPPGNTWDHEIEKALERCSCLLFISSQTSVSSENVLNEVYFALEEKKKIVPIKIDDCKIPFRIRRLQYIDLSNDYEDGFQSLLTVLNLDKKTQQEENSAGKNNNESVKVDENNIQEDELWYNTIQQDTIASYQNYLKRFPEGKKAGKAISLIKHYELMREKKLWGEAIAKNTLYHFQNYLKETHLKTYAEEAGKKIYEIEKQNVKRKEEEFGYKTNGESVASGFHNAAYSSYSGSPQKPDHFSATKSATLNQDNRIDKRKFNIVLYWIASGLIISASFVAWNYSRPANMTEHIALTSSVDPSTIAIAVKEPVIDSTQVKSSIKKINSINQPSSNEHIASSNKKENYNEQRPGKKVVETKTVNIHSIEIEKKEPAKDSPVHIKISPTRIEPIVVADNATTTVAAGSNAAKEEYKGRVRIPAGLQISVVLDETLSSEEPSKDGTHIKLHCVEDIKSGGRTVIRKDAYVIGKIVDVVPSRGRRKALIGFVIERIIAVDGSKINLDSKRYRQIAEEPGKPAFFKEGQLFSATLGRGEIK